MRVCVWSVLPVAFRRSLRQGHGALLCVFFAMAVLGAAALEGCASSAPVAQAPSFLFQGDHFAPPSVRIRASDVFAASDAMRKYLQVDISLQLHEKGRVRGLVDALYRHGQLKLEYDSTMTRNAAEAFAARRGNCLSLVIMTAALAKELDLRVEYRSAYQEETWSRSGNLYIRSGHVNIALAPGLAHRGDTVGSGETTIDFLPGDEIEGMRTRSIAEPTIVAMFMNNRAAEALVQGQLDDAYWWAREAIAQDPSFASAFNTLGVVYQHHGNLAQAEQVLDYVLEREPRNTRAMFNLSQVLAQRGDKDGAAALKARLAQLEPDPPFHYFDLGMAAMQRGDYADARELFAKEVARADYYHEFHFWLAQADYRLGRFDEAREELELARRTSTTHDERDLYAAKLAWLKSGRTVRR